MDSSTNVPLLLSNTSKRIIHFLSYILKTYIFEETEVFRSFSKDIGVVIWHNSEEAYNHTRGKILDDVIKMVRFELFRVLFMHSF